MPRHTYSKFSPEAADARIAGCIVTCMFRKLSIAAIAVPLSACGFAMQGPPPGHQQMTQFECSQSIGAPVADVVGAAAIGGLGFTVLAFGSMMGGSVSSAAALLAFAPPALLGTSAVKGFRTGGRCRAAKRALALRLAIGTAVARADATAPGAAASPRSQPFTISIEGSKDTIVVGSMLQLLASARTPSGADIPNLRYRWNSSDPATAMVGLAGRVRAMTPGLVTITAQYGVVAETVTVIVVRP